jgi:hypothetical protein
MKTISISWLIFLQLALAFEWLHSALGKWLHPEFMDGIGKTLGTFASKTNHRGYAEFLNSVAVPNAEMFGNMIRVGELAVGLALLLSGLIILKQKQLSLPAAWIITAACFGGALMNINFFLASGWSSPAAWGLNILMAATEIILGIFYLSHRHELQNRP